MKTKKNLLVLLLAVMLCASALCVSIFADTQTAQASATITVDPANGHTRIDSTNGDCAENPLVPGSVQTPYMKAGIYKVEVKHTVDGKLTTYYPGIQIGGGCYAIKYPAPSGSERTYTVYALLPEGVSTLTFFEYYSSRGDSFPTGHANYFDLIASEVKLTAVKEFKPGTVIFDPKLDMVAGSASETPIADISYWHDKGDGNYYPAANIDTNSKKADSAAVAIDAIVNGYIAHQGGASKSGFGNAYQWMEGVGGGIYFRDSSGEQDELRFQITVPQDGLYTIYAPNGVNADTVNLTWKTKTAADAAWGDPKVTTLKKTNPENSTSSALGPQWDKIGAVELKAGKNYISLTTGKYTVAAMAFEYTPSYTVTWKNWDGSVLKTEKIAEGQTPAWSGEEPERTTTPTTEYTFSGWTPTIVALTGDTTYTATYTESAHEHTYSIKYEKDENGHWKICQKCKEAKPSEAHGTPVDDKNCATSGKCPTCGYILVPAEEHVYTVDEHDEAQHWQKCANCDVTTMEEEHTGGTASCTAKAVCSVCAAEYGDLLAHTYEQKSDNTKHWKACTVCGNQADEAAHSYGEDGKCACGAEKSGCGASIAASAIAVTAVLGLGIGFIRKKKED